ncbi:hypothetical protein [Pedobacter boryungensis]|uniref:Uncharacterized protein n=1 Tax=Pedobacter boryungensis TaxID=869962 RepID=A0ABX2D8B9_9SPHI|nr:hypothetical protein [Pedobacter boryungensis]NQX30298.1 hypothetical protein [Pedobacter boryungensis]
MKQTSKFKTHSLSKLTSVLFVFLTISFNSCKKDSNEIQSKDIVSETKEWFALQTNNKSLTTSLFRQHILNKTSSLDPSGTKTIPSNADHPLSIDWKDAKTYQTSDSTIVEVPVRSSGIFNFNTEVPINGKKMRTNKSITKLLFIKTALKTEGYFMTIINSDEYLAETSSNPSKNTFLQKEQNFTGTIVYHDLQGNMTNVVSIGKSTRLNKQESLKSSFGTGRVSQALPPTCVETPIYEVFGVGCVDINEYYIFCESVYSVYVGHTICGDGGGVPPTNPGGGGAPGGGSGGSNSSNEYNPQEFQFSSDPAIYLSDLFNCFNNISSTMATYSITLSTDLPVNSDPNKLVNYSSFPPSPGHAFITLTKTNGTNMVTKSFGFYPDPDILSLTTGPVGSKMNDNGAHDYDANISMSLTAGEFQLAISKALEKRNMSYDIDKYNCTDYALDVFNAVRDVSNKIEVPNWVGTLGYNYGKTPNGLYNRLALMKSYGNNSISLVKGNATAKSGVCN